MRDASYPLVLSLGAAAFFIFFPGAAGTGIVATDLSSAAHYLLDRLQIARTGHASLFQLAAFLALESFFNFVDRRGDLPRWLAAIAVAHSRNGDACVGPSAGNTAISRSGRSAFARPLQNLHQVEIADGVLLRALHHGFEHVEGLALVLDQRVVLPVAAQTDAFLQVVHVAEVVFPLRVEHA